ncbi:hypothetical protein HanRHA438_Chr16g0752361 [Helianthus annuus]|nr:hypothetical protein HanOQP8_Chr16g0610471 [Helianthus annuus]KAJ0835196.1 hypothetical protein HanRHA438_Chr16g0752361 [Helianthus annuus]
MGHSMMLRYTFKILYSYCIVILVFQVVVFDSNLFSCKSHFRLTPMFPPSVGV